MTPVDQVHFGDGWGNCYPAVASLWCSAPSISTRRNLSSSRSRPPTPLDKQRFFADSHGWQHRQDAKHRNVNTLRTTVLASLGGLVREGLVVVTEPGRYALAERVAQEVAA